MGCKQVFSILSLSLYLYLSLLLISEPQPSSKADPPFAPDALRSFPFGETKSIIHPPFASVAPYANTFERIPLITARSPQSAPRIP